MKDQVSRCADVPWTEEFGAEHVALRDVDRLVADG
jgi:hypothetical protein